MIHLLLVLIKFDLKLFCTKKGKFIHPFIFYIITAFTFPFSTNADPGLIKILAPSIISISILFASIISTTNIFEEDYDDGFLEQLYANAIPAYLIILSKIISHWLIVTLPIVITLPFIFVILEINQNIILLFTLTTILISLIISAIGVFSSSLTIGISKATALSAIISIPLTIICLIFFTLSIENLINNHSLEKIISLFNIIIGINFIIIPTICFFSGIILKDVSNNYIR